jgi:hypothetical protein
VPEVFNGLGLAYASRGKELVAGQLLVMSHEQLRAAKALVNCASRQHNDPGLGAVAVTRHVSSVSP